jgi:hypothetical protein
MTKPDGIPVGRGRLFRFREVGMDYGTSSIDFSCWMLMQQRAVHSHEAQKTDGHVGG